MKQFLAPFLEVFEILAIVLVSIYIIYGFIAQPFLVKGASMEPNFLSGDYLLVDEISYQFREPVRGEVIVFKNPSKNSEFYIKRIIGLPGEDILINDGSVFVNGDIISEIYLSEDIPLDGEYTFSLDEDEYFVMGDNRPKSYDSRNWGPLEEDLIVGIVRFRFWPLSNSGLLAY